MTSFGFTSYLLLNSSHKCGGLRICLEYGDMKINIPQHYMATDSMKFYLRDSFAVSENKMKDRKPLMAKTYT